jgi:hypothetical protein
MLFLLLVLLVLLLLLLPQQLLPFASFAGVKKLLHKLHLWR